MASDSAPPYDLLAAEYDLEEYRGPVHRSYVICSTPRSGSTLLAEALHLTGRLGVPSEYMGVDVTVPYLYERWACAGMNDYVSKLHSLRSSADGIFGIKIHWHQLLQFSNVSQAKPPEAPLEFPILVGVLKAVAPNPRFLFITRRDRVRQAVSHWIASQTLEWHDLGTGADRPTPPYDYDGIARMMAGIDESEESWNRFLAMGRVEPMRIVYEDLVADYEGTVRAAIAFIGLPAAEIEVRPPRLRKQSRSISAGYADRFREEHASRNP